jgi:glycosyltransferase involved in cell wall biosynthesis
MRAVRYRPLKSRPVNINRVDNAVWPKEAPLVSVIIPYYNRADTIDDTLESLLHQTFHGFETIVVDDGSSEQASVNKLKQISKEFPSVKVLSQANLGVAEARNTGVKAAKGKYIICLDSDDVLDPTFIEKATLVLEAEPDIGLVTAYMQMFGVRSELLSRSKKTYSGIVQLCNHAMSKTKTCTGIDSRQYGHYIPTTGQK